MIKESYIVTQELLNKVSRWVDSDFANDVDTRKSMTGYLMSLNGVPISWKSSRQWGVTQIQERVRVEIYFSTLPATCTKE